MTIKKKLLNELLGDRDPREVFSKDRLIDERSCVPGLWAVSRILCSRPIAPSPIRAVSRILCSRPISL